MQEMSSSRNDDRPLLSELIDARLKQLGISRATLVQRWGYRDAARGMRRLQEVSRAAHQGRGLLELARALELPQVTILRAYANTLQFNIAKAEEAERAEFENWCANFRPHVILCTAEKIPRPTFVAAILGVERILRREIDLKAPQERWPATIASQLPTHVIAFGDVTGFVVNYTPFQAAEYDRNGVFVQPLSQAVRPGRASFELSHRQIGSGEFDAVLRKSNAQVCVYRLDKADS